MEHETPDHPLLIWQQAIWLLIALLTPLFVNFWVEQQFEASKVWLFRTLTWTLATLWLGGWLTGLRPKARRLPARNLLFGLSLVLILSTLVSTYRPIAVFGTLDRANGVLTQLSFLLFFFCVATRIDAPRSRQLLTAVVFTAVPICLLGLAQAAGWQPLPVLTDARTLLTTTLGRANFTGAYLALLLPLTLAAAQMAPNRRQRLSFGALAGLELVVIALTQARAAWIAAAVGLGLYWWLRRAPQWTRRTRRLTMLGGLAGLSGGLLLVLQRGIASGGSIAARWTIWQASLRLLWPRLWLGYGADTLELHFPSVYPPQLVYYQGRGIIVDRAHNWLLDWSLSYGVVATLLFIALVALIVRAGWQQLCGAPNSTPSTFGEPPLESTWVVACLAAVCAQLVGNLFLFEVAATSVLFWLLLAIITAATSNDRPQMTQLPVPAWLWRGVALAAVIILVWAVWQLNVLPLLADGHSWRGTQALNQGDVLEALAEYETAVVQQPHRIPYRSALALTAAQLGKYRQAEAVMQEAISLRPADPVLQTQLAAIYAREAAESPEKSELAYAAYEQAIALAPTIALTHQQYADLALLLGDLATAQRQAQQAVTLDATDGISFGILGWVELQNGNLAAARLAFEQAVKWQPDSADFYLGLAIVFDQQSNFVAARQAVQESLNRDPVYTPALELQLKLQEK